MSKSISRNVSAFQKHVEYLIKTNASINVEYSFVIYDVHPHNRDVVLHNIREQRDEYGFSFTKEPKYCKESYELTIYGMFKDDSTFKNATYEEYEEYEEY